MAEEEKKTEEGVQEATAPEAAPTETPKEEAPAETPKAEPKEEVAEEPKAAVEVPAKFKKIVEEIEAMTVVELNELVKVFEEKFGVSATAVTAAGPASGGDAGGDEGSSEVNVKLASAGDQKIAVIKAVKEALGLGLKEAKDLVDDAPSMLKEGMKKEDADALKAKIEEAGGKVEYA